MVEAILARSDDGEGPGHQPRGTAGGRRTALAGAVTGHRIAARRELFVERAARSRHAIALACRRRDQTQSWRSAGASTGFRWRSSWPHRGMQSDDGHRGARSSRRPLPAAGGIAARTGTPPDAAPRGAVVLRPARRRRKGLAGKLFGVRRRVRPGGRVRGGRLGRRVRDAGPARFPGAQVASGRRPDLGRTRFSMLETIRQFAEEQLVAAGDADDTRTAHARYFAGRETDVLTLWDGPRQREAYDWFDRRVGQPARRIPLGRRPRRPRHRRRHRRLRRVPRVLGRTVRARRRGPRNSSNPRGPSTIARLAQLYAWPRSATRPAGPMMPSAMPKQQGWPSIAAVSTGVPLRLRDAALGGTYICER